MNKRILASILFAGTISLTQAQQKKSIKKIVATQNSDYQKLTGDAIVTVDVAQLIDKNGRFFLRSSNINDSASIIDNKIVYKTHLSEPQIAYLMYYTNAELKQDLKKLRVQRKNLFPFYLTVGHTNILAKDSLQAAQLIHPNAYQTAYDGVEKKQRHFELTEMLPLVKNFYAALGKGDQATAKTISDKLDSLGNLEKESIFKPFIEQNAANSPVALAIITQYANNGTDPEKVAALFDKLALTYKKLPTGEAIQSGIDRKKQQLQQEKATQIGQPAPDFTQNDTSGHAVSLKDFRGKYVLVDFWASWCGPCRGENPNVVAAFQKYHDKNFTILGVSFDQNKESWLAAIHKDGLTWNHVSDLQYWDNAVGKIYGIQSIPANLLIDPNGNIVAKDIRGEELQQTLEKVLGK